MPVEGYYAPELCSRLYPNFPFFWSIYSYLIKCTPQIIKNKYSYEIHLKLYVLTLKYLS